MISCNRLSGLGHCLPLPLPLALPLELEPLEGLLTGGPFCGLLQDRLLWFAALQDEQTCRLPDGHGYSHRPWFHFMQTWKEMSDGFLPEPLERLGALSEND